MRRGRKSSLRSDGAHVHEHGGELGALVGHLLARGGGNGIVSEVPGALDGGLDEGVGVARVVAEVGSEPAHASKVGLAAVKNRRRID